MTYPRCRPNKDPVPRAASDYSAGLISFGDFAETISSSHVHVWTGDPTPEQRGRSRSRRFTPLASEAIPLPTLVLPDGSTALPANSCAQFHAFGRERYDLPSMRVEVATLVESLPSTAILLNPGSDLELWLPPSLIAIAAHTADAQMGGLGSLGESLSQRSRRRLVATTHRRGLYPDVLAGLAGAYDTARWYRENYPWHDAILQLLDLAMEDIERGTEAALGGDALVTSFSARRLMETEFLLRCFANDARRIVEWATAEPHVRASRFSFAETRKMVERAEGVSAGQALPDRAEYQAHSESAHPVPRSGREGPVDMSWEFLFSAGDLAGHVARLLDAAHLLAEAQHLAPRPGAAPIPSDVPLRQVLDHVNEIIRGVGFRTRPTTMPIAWSPEWVRNAATNN